MMIMSEKRFYFNKKIQNIEIKMLRKKHDFYIKIIPIIQKSKPMFFFIIIDGENYKFDIYDEKGRESHKIYLKANNVNPCFYLILDDIYYKILCKNNDIIITRKLRELSTNFNLNDIINFDSNNISCWAINIYMTSRKEKPPYCYM